MRTVLISTLMILVTAVAFFAGYSIGVNKLTISSNVVSNTAENIQTNYSWTTAICDVNRTCFDAYVECSGNKALSVTPVTGMITFNESWEDPRKDHSLCPRN